MSIISQKNLKKRFEKNVIFQNGDKIKKIVSFAVILLFAMLTGCLKTSVQPTEIVILHTNDMHGRVIGNDTDVIGIDRIAAIHKNTPNSVLMDAGDTLHGLPVATLSRGADITALMKAAGYSAMTIGNHEFNYGWERLEELREIAGFPFLASNVLKENDSTFLDDTTIIELNGVKIGLFGITTESAAYSVMPEYVSGLVFLDPITVAKDKVALLQERGVHMIVAICHLGNETHNGTLSAQLAREVSEIDVIIDGHSHTELSEGITENGVLIAQAGYYGNSLGKVVITVENDKIISKVASLISFEESRNIEPDAAVTAILNEITVNSAVLLSKPIGESVAEMSSARAPGLRTQEMPLGNLVADAYRETADADIAIANGGDIRADIMPGIITKGDIISILPFGNTLMVKTVTPALLRKILENGVSGIVVDTEGNIDHEQSPQGRFLQVSGFSFSYDPTAPEGERILSITLDGDVLSLDDEITKITLAGSNYVMTGGDYYTMLSSLPVDRELDAADEALAAYIAKHSPIAAPETGRINTVKAEQPETLVIYTSMKDSLITALTDDFMDKNPNITAEVRIDGAGNLMAQIESERQAGQILADLIWTSEIPDFYYMKDEGLLLQYTPNGTEDVFNPLEGTDGYFIPARLGTMGIAYNTDIIKTPPTSWRDLLGEDYTNSFVFANPETSGTALMAVVLLTEAFGEDFFRELRSNGAFVGQGSTWVVDSIANGEIAAGLAVDYITFDKARSGAPIAMFYPQEMLVIPSPVAIFKDGVNISAAQKFTDYLITPEAQALIANSGTLPVLDGIPAQGEYNIPSGNEAMVRAIDVDEADILTRKDEIVGMFLEIMRLSL